MGMFTDIDDYVVSVGRRPKLSVFMDTLNEEDTEDFRKILLNRQYSDATVVGKLAAIGIEIGPSAFGRYRRKVLLEKALVD